MQDKLVRAATQDGLIRIAAIRATGLVENARQRHNTTPTATAALGRALIATVFLGLNIKGDDTVTLRILGDGPLGGIITQAGANNAVRGYIQEPDVHLPLKNNGKLDVGSAVGKNGFFYVTKDIKLKDIYTSSSPLVSGEIGEDLAYYFSVSEQIPSAVGLGVLVDPDFSCLAAGGFLLQTLPGAGDEVIAKLEENIKKIPPVSSLIHEGYEPEKIIELILNGAAYDTLGEDCWQFSCSCNRERLAAVLKTFGKDELQDMLKKNQGAEIRCHFCSEVYRFTAVDLEKLLAELEEDNKKADS